MSEAFFHDESRAVRFYVLIDGVVVGASIDQHTLHHCFRPRNRDEKPLETFKANAERIEAAVRRRVENGAYNPVLLREFDLRPVEPQAPSVAGVSD